MGQVVANEYQAITTVHEDGWRLYGRRMAQSFVERWRGVLLTIYAEGFDPDVAGVSVERLPEWQERFKRDHSASRDAIGRAGEHYDYRRDCVRFSHKVGAITDAVERCSGRLIWLDADTYTHADVDAAWLDELMPAGQAMAWLDRADMYPEAGFLVLDCGHPGLVEAMRRFRAIYETGEVFGLPETHDSFVLQYVVERAVADGLIPRPCSLSGDYRNSHHPFVAGPLGARLDHLKGSRKVMERSTDYDTGRQRSEPYWQ